MAKHNDCTSTADNTLAIVMFYSTISIHLKPLVPLLPLNSKKRGSEQRYMSHSGEKHDAIPLGIITSELCTETTIIHKLSEKERRVHRQWRQPNIF